MNAFRPQQLLTFLALLLIQAGCSTDPVSLNEPVRSVLARNVGSMQPQVLPFERQVKNNLAVSYHLTFARGPYISGYRLTLVLTNETEKPVKLPVAFRLMNATGLVLAPMYGDSYLTLLARDAGKGVPEAEARRWMQWETDYWLKSEYTLEPGTSVTGVQIFPSTKLRHLPLHLTVECGETVYDFVTVGSGS